MARWKGIVGERFSPDEFWNYVESLSFSWRANFAVLHNTWSPTRAQRPEGFTHQHMLNLQAFYMGKGWSGGPHCFVDQNPRGIWVFTPLTTPGVHSPSWNNQSWGIEMLGNYDTEEFDTQVRDNAVAAIATLYARFGIDSSTLRFHREDPLTTHRDCPGKNVSKPDMVQRVHDLLTTWYSGEHEA